MLEIRGESFLAGIVPSQRPSLNCIEYSETHHTMIMIPCVKLCHTLNSICGYIHVSRIILMETVQGIQLQHKVQCVMYGDVIYRSCMVTMVIISKFVDCNGIESCYI